MHDLTDAEVLSECRERFGVANQHSEPDYEAAWDDGAELLYDATWDQLDDVERAFVIDAVRDIVDAAIGGKRLVEEAS